MLINSPRGATTVTQVTGDNYAIPSCGGDIPDPPSGYNSGPTEIMARIILGSATPGSEPDPGDLAMTIGANSWSRSGAPFTTTTLGVAHQFTIWFKFESSDPMTPPVYVPDFASFTPSL